MSHRVNIFLECGITFRGILLECFGFFSFPVFLLYFHLLSSDGSIKRSFIRPTDRHTHTLHLRRWHPIHGYLTNPLNPILNATSRLIRLLRFFISRGRRHRCPGSKNGPHDAVRCQTHMRQCKKIARSHKGVSLSTTSGDSFVDPLYKKNANLCCSLGRCSMLTVGAAPVI